MKLVDANNMYVYTDQTTSAIAARHINALAKVRFFWRLYMMDHSGSYNLNTPWFVIFSVLCLFSVTNVWRSWVF